MNQSQNEERSKLNAEDIPRLLEIIKCWKDYYCIAHLGLVAIGRAYLVKNTKSAYNKLSKEDQQKFDIVTRYLDESVVDSENLYKIGKELSEKAIDLERNLYQ